MIPILYERNETQFNTNGVGRLSDCLSCIVTEERNGIYECEFTYPMTGERFKDIQEGRIIYATHDETGQAEPFEIYRRSAPMDGIVTFNAHHISYRLSNVVVKPYAATGIAEALRGISHNSVNTNTFTFETDKTSEASYSTKVPRIARGILAGEEGSILDVYGSGEYEFNQMRVILHEARGEDRGVEIRFGKNLIDLLYETDTSGVINAIAPYWYSEETGELVILPEYAVPGAAPVYLDYWTEHNEEIIENEQGNLFEFAYQILAAQPLDMSSSFETKPTVSELRAAALQWLNTNKPWMTSENLEVDFVQLWQTEEYKDIAPLQQVNLCDTVAVYYPELDIRVVEKVIKTEYNTLLDRYDKIELGDPRKNYADVVGSAIETAIMEKVPTKEDLQQGLDLIRGGLGGYVILKPGENGRPEEILIMDSPDKDTAVNVIRMNKGGIAFSHSGYDGPFISAWTMNADFNIGGGGNSYGVIHIYDESGNASGMLHSSGLHFEEPGVDNIVTYYRQHSISFSKVNYETTPPTEDVLGNLMYDNDFSPRGRYLIYFMTPVHVKSGLYGIELTASAGSNGEYVKMVGNTYVNGTFKASGTKSRQVETDHYQDRLLYAYETPTPYFGDLGEAVIDEDGFGYVDIDPIFSETVASNFEYQVFLQKEGPGDCWVAEKHGSYFVIEGTPGLKVAWELKSAQKGYENLRLEEGEEPLASDEYAVIDDSILDDLSYYIEEQEEMLYEAAM